VDLVIRSGTHNYIQFRGLEASFIWTPEGLSPVPSSRADVFKDRTLSAVEKRYLMRFFKMVIDQTSTPNLEASQLCEEDLDLPFVEFLHRQKLPSSVQAYNAVPTLVLFIFVCGCLYIELVFIL
jgi:RAB protein geranylgeranyltransferase component A